MEDWSLVGDLPQQLLRWAAQLHELGLDIAHNQYHKHGAYILENADLLGFSRQEQHLLAVLVRAHRRKYPTSVVRALPANWLPIMQQLIVLLRLAVVLHRSRSPDPLPPLMLKGKSRSLVIQFPKHWLREHPLTRADLEEEAEFLRVADIQLKVR
jgi:exopolyphosphatase/guanosine-5'-triphosphate,3'-diphosphate pyrophosphatase